MGEKSVDALTQRIKEHNDRKGGAMTTATEARKQAAEVARRRDAERAAGAAKNTERKRNLEVDYPTPSNPSGKVFVDYGKKG